MLCEGSWEGFEMASTYGIESQQAGRDINQAGRDINQAGRDLYQAERDIFITYEQLLKETDFFEPNLEPFKYPNFISPTITPQLIENIRLNRLLVLGGSTDIDKSALARHLAGRLSETQQELDPARSKVPILEWNRSSSDLQSAEIKLRETTKATIFILPKISPQDVRYDLSYIKKIADINQHFVLISTDVPYPSWKLPNVDQRFWQEIPDDIYSIDDLATFLKESLPKEFLSILLEMGISKTAKELKTPENISTFIELLCAEKKTLQLQVVNDLIKDANDKQRTIKRWYLALTPREQLLALGLGFFDGLFDDQFFAALDKVVERVWQRRDSSLRALDYCDLDNLRNFFDFVPSEGYGIKIESRIPEQRRMLFEVAWNSHRRQILTALPVIAQLAADSVADRSHNPELYGSSTRRDQLRMVIGEALSDIGLISINAVQRTLFQLASDDDLGVQVVAARAMSRWRQYKRDDDLFRILKNWQEKDGRPGNSRDRIRAAVALTVSYASRYDDPNELNEELCELLKNLAKDQSPLVRKPFCTHTLPYVVPRHVIKLRETLQEMTQEIDLISDIAKSLALAYRYNDKDVKETLDIWDQKCRALQPSLGNSTEVTQREKLLATIALTYGYIKYDNVTSGLTASKAFKWMQNILDEEENAFVHKNVIFAISHQASHNFEKVEPSLRNLVIKMAQSDSDEIVQLLKEIYLEQRQELGKGDDFIDAGGKRYPIWIGSGRPITDVEKAMYRWIKSQDNPAAQQIAVRALVAFASALDQKEEQQIMEVLEQQNRPIAQPEPEKPIIITQVSAIKKITPIEKIAVWFATWGKKPYNAIIQGLLPEILSQNRHNKPVMTFVLEKWQKATDSELNKIVQLQESAIWLVERPALMVGAPLLGVLALLVVIVVMQNAVLFIILLLVITAIVFYKFRSSLVQKQEGIKSISAGQITLWLRDNLKR
jgi:hypothetical protein